LLEGFIEGGLSKERPLIVDIDATGSSCSIRKTRTETRD
jgi:hypothetical protein